MTTIDSRKLFTEAARHLDAETRLTESTSQTHEGSASA